MLQQTTVAAVTPRFERFVARWPTIEALAGRERRGRPQRMGGPRLLRPGAQPHRVRPRGRAPRRLPAHGGRADRSCPASAPIPPPRSPRSRSASARRSVDTNVERVVARLHGARAAVGRARSSDLMLAMTPADRPGDFAQAMMDLGATICRPKAPRCGRLPAPLPMRAHSRAARPKRFPAAKAKRARPLRHGIAWWIERDGKVWLVRRPPRGLLGGMAALPGSEWSAEPPRAAPDALGTRPPRLHPFRARSPRRAAQRSACGEGWWQPLDRLAEAGLPTPLSPRRRARASAWRAAPRA